jgi:hypothetical protein
MVVIGQKHAGGSVTDADLREQKILDKAFLRAGGPTNKKLIWCGLMLLFKRNI